LGWARGAFVVAFGPDVFEWHDKYPPVLQVGATA